VQSGRSHQPTYYNENKRRAVAPDPAGSRALLRSSCAVAAFRFILARFDELGIELSLLGCGLERFAGIRAEATIFYVSIQQVAAICCAVLRLTIVRVSVQQLPVKKFSVFLLVIECAVIAKTVIEPVEMFANYTHLFAQRGQHGGRPAFTARDPADKGRVYAELASDALVESAKYGEHGKRICANIRVVTIHDALFNAEEKMYS
jgi:hypothetical protein